MAWYNWSQTASSNATADSTINWAEGQAPSSVNDSARAMMAATAKYRDDITGAIVTTGTSTAYIVASNSTFDTLAHLNGQIIAFSPHTTNGATVTLNVDSLGAKPLRSSPGVELQAGTIIQGTPYVAIYNNSDGAFYLQSFYGNPYNIPLLGGLDYWGPTAPNSAFVFPIGQAISRTTYAAIFAIVSTSFGVGDGSTTFNLPDRRGRTSAQLDPTGTVLTSFSMSPNGNTVGAKGGNQGTVLITANLPPYTPSGTVTSTASTGSNNVTSFSGSSSSATGGGANSAPPIANSTSAPLTVSSSFNGSAQGGTSSEICQHSADNRLQLYPENPVKVAHKVGAAGSIMLAVAFIEPWEGLWTTAKVDTIGTGHPVTYCYGQTNENGNVKAGEKFTPQECSALLEKTLPTYLAKIKPCIKVDIPDKVQAALVSAAYNAGPAAVCKSPMLAKINAGDISGGCEAFRGWYVHASGRVVKGLINRRASESQLCMEGASDPKPEPASRWTKLLDIIKSIFERN